MRYQQHQAELEDKLRQEDEKLAHDRVFHARPAPHPAPFFPKKSIKPLTQPSEVTLYSSERAEQRRQFDEKLHHKELEMADLKKQQDLVRKAREAEEMREFRKNLVPQAQPVHHYAPVHLKSSERPLTIPKSPALQTSMRLRKQQNE
jgi:hypothetical protein